MLEAFEYAQTTALNADVQAALKGDPIATELRRLLEVLVDNDKFKELLLTQYEVREPAPYGIKVFYRDADGEEVDPEAVKALQKKGKSLSLYGIETKYLRVSKDTGKSIGEASEAEILEFNKDKNS